MTTAQRPPAVISIYIPKQGFVRQGKFTYLNDKPYFIANMTPRKWFKNYAGYSIAKRILEALPRGTTIVYKRLDLNTYYLTNKTRFASKGVLVAYGGHSQWVLPLKNWETKAGKFEEPHQLPVISLDRWLKGSPEAQSPKDPSGDVLSQRLRMRAEFFNALNKKGLGERTTRLPGMAANNAATTEGLIQRIF